MHRLFVIRDFSIKGGLDLSLEELSADPPEGYERVTVLGRNDIRFGDLARDQVLKELRDSNRALALCDCANANVGFEIGFAAGRGLPVGLATVGGERAPWLKRPPLNGFVVVL